MEFQRGKRNIFVLIDIETGADENGLIERLLEFQEIKEVHVISGQYDILAVAEIDLHGKPVFSTVQELSQDVIKKVRKIRGIRDTNTIVPYLTATR